MVPRGATTRFVADAMLGSLARKLRALGYDTTYYGKGEDAALVGQAKREGRVILTADRQLASWASSRVPKVILVTGRNDGSRIRAIGQAARASGIKLVSGDSLCSLCGGEMEPLTKKDVVGRVPPPVGRRHRLFYRCRSCGQIYWRGTHWKKLRSLARRLGEK